MEARYHYDKEKCSSIEDFDNLIKSYLRIKPQKIINGFANFELDVPTNVTKIKMTVQYFGQEESVIVRRFPAKSREFLKAKVNEE